MPGNMLIVSCDRHDIRIAESAALEQSVGITVARSYREALGATADRAISLILSEHALRDGSWKDLLSRLIIIPEPPLFVLVAEPCDQSLWAEAIDAGVYDVIAKPLHPLEARHLILRALWSGADARMQAPGQADAA